MNTRWWMLAVLFLCFLGIRLYFIYTFPPFTDESLYVRWGMLMVDNPAFRWASIEHISRQPLAFWLFGFGALQTFDPVIGARLIVLIANIPVFFAVYFLTNFYTDRTRALIAAALLTFTPLFILTQSLALMDGLIFALASAVIWYMMARRKHLTIQDSIVMGILTGAALWIKSTAVYIVLAWALSLVRAHPESPKRILAVFSRLSVYLITLLIVILPLLLRPDIGKVIREPGSFMQTSAGLFPFMKVWTSNIANACMSLLIYLGPALLGASVYFKRISKHPGTLHLIAWCGIPVIVTVLLTTNFRFRYAVLGMAAAIPLLSAGFTELWKKEKMKIPAIAAGLLIVSYGLFFTVSPVTVFSWFPETSGERDYAFSWPSGYGIPDLVSWIDAHTGQNPVILAVADSPGNPGDYILSYYYLKTTARVIIATISSESEFRKIEPLTRKIPVYLATRESLIIPGIRPFLTEIIRFPKPQNRDAIVLYGIRF